MEQCDAYHANTVRRPMEEWLAANDIPVEETLLWGDLEVDEAAGVIHIEMFWKLPADTPADGCDGGCTRQAITVIGRGPTSVAGTLIRQYPLKQPMSPELADAYARAKVHAKASEQVRELVAKMQFQGTATVITARDGDHLIFVVPGAEPEYAGKLIKALEPVLPGVGLTVLNGVSGVIHSGGELGHLSHL